MKKLHPTLWRTCRMLSGKTRLELLRLVIDRPDQMVTELATQLKISLPRASQELRRLQSRGLLQAVRNGLHVRYRPVPDRLVATARPLLQAMQETFRRFPSTEDEQTLRIAIAFSHARRLSLARLLLIGTMNTQMLEEMADMSRNALNRHLRRLRDGGIVQRNGKMISIAENPHPLAQSLLGILGERQAPPA
jgi:DNA-binding transcriptional ArsR family regulator